MSDTALTETHLPNREPVARGKVRDIYDAEDKLIIVATDRISAFDWINPVGIPDKGKLLTQMSLFWFDQMRDLVKIHLVSADLADFPADFQAAPEQFDGRSMLVYKCEMFAVEFVIRGYLAGSGWREYKEKGTVCGLPLPAGLVESSKLEKPLFTPATKATDGHDINISPERAGEIIGKEWAASAAAAAENVYLRARDIAESKSIILCDTKFEFGTRDGELMLADEILTPDSSRFWPADQYEPGKPQPSYDKQFVRDWLETTGWDKNSPPPPLPDDIVAKTREKYVEAYRKLTGRTDF
ncbi:MAG TPA: phosphoribosylaminoimidazolesuccinocarboxamide synthase [Candidatus Hydrogenedentes bacterium]|nr:phosphoribosylaminoimidazolesuccinocarboxamide synthase [Candidatus Hydrogenedentota bacterium]